ncbi:MAG: 2-C-methyl-D-erythritol 4-phosphate cytidylyltransferase [Spirochaetota bacterium]
MSNIYAIILAGGIGKRMGQDTPKQFIKIKNKPVIIRTIERFVLPQITGIIITVPEDFIDYTGKLIKEFAVQNIIKIIKGGETRQGSSYNAITCMDFHNDDILVFHDAARPFIETQTIELCIKEADAHGASGVYLKATDTIAKINEGFVRYIPDRDKLYYTQTPQAFRYNIIKKAHELAISNGLHNPTDDVQLVLNAGFKVKIVEGDSRNIKITNAFDLELAEFIAGKAI